MREKSKKGYKDTIDVACLELLNKSERVLAGEVSNQGPRRTVSREWKDLLREREGSSSSELIAPVKAAANSFLTLFGV